MLKALCVAAAIALLAGCADSGDPAPPPSGPLPEGHTIGRPAGYADLCKREPENFLCRS
jgi:predicted transglutaminase-like cysteine proteinase